jgi:MerR family transcriptional regulator/heat shock protein HspR
VRAENQPVYMIGVAAQLCGVHPQTLRQYERLGLINPSRVGSKNRLYSEADILRVRRIQRLTQEMGVNLAGVDLILRLLDDMEDLRRDFEVQITTYIDDAETRIAQMMSANSSVPVRKDQTLLPVPNIRLRQRVDL